MKKNLKPCVYERSERERRRAFCIMSLRVGVTGEVKRLRRVSRSESEPEQGESRWCQTRNLVIYPWPG